MSTYLNRSFGASDYAKFRPTYPPQFFDYIVDYRSKYTSTPLNTIVDLACGTGQATKALGKYCNKVIGLDHSEVMIAEARKQTPDPKFEFHVASDATLTSVIEPHSVDLLTVAEGAHYLKFPEFWYSASQVLRSGGMVAIFSYWTFSFPEHSGVSQLINNYAYADDQCGPYWDAGREVLNNGYKDLLKVIPKDQFDHIEHVENDFNELRPEAKFELVKTDVPVGEMISLLKTWSPYFNWKNANPQKPDIADQVMEDIRGITGLKPENKVTVKWNTVYILAMKK